jgi:DNA-binding HxlR family transcriptional regulator
MQVVLKIFYCMEELKKRSDCPLSCSLDVFGDKWSLLIIRDLMFNKKNTYNDFLKSDEGIATNILASRLKGLEENGIIERSEHPDSKAKILYRLTQKGIDLLPIIMEVYIWSDKYSTIPAEIKATIKVAKKDKDKFVKQVTKELKNDLKEKKQQLKE